MIENKTCVKKLSKLLCFDFGEDVKQCYAVPKS